MKAKSIKGDSTNEIKIAFEQSLIDGFMPTLAIVFMSVKQDMETISSLLDENGILVFGVSSSGGEFIDEDFGEGTIAILLLDIKKDQFFIDFENFNGADERKILENIGLNSQEKFKNPGFIIGGTNVVNIDPEQLLRGLQDAIGEQVNVFGVMAGDDYTFTGQYVFTNGKSSKDGVVVLTIDEDKIKMDGHMICGWKALGIEKTITKSQGNQIYTINNEPALDAIARYGGLDASKENKNLTWELGIHFPLQLQKENSTHVIRNGFLVNWDDRSITCSGVVPEGSKVKFSLPPELDAIEDVIEGCRMLKENDVPEADAMIYLSCGGRLMAFGPLMKNEIEGVSNIWNVPMVGMFSNSELGRSRSGNLEHHNLSSCCVVLKEK
jgi:hypothetical protein